MDNPRPIVVHMIGNAHIDPVWLWRMREGRAEVLATYRSALERMEETPDFVFTSGGTVTYRWVQEDDPAMFAAIQARVAEGRWALVNGWWVQPDCNIPSGESFVRHGLYGQRGLQAMFGRRAVTGYNVDSFGHAGSLPKILRHCGLRYYVFFRPAPGVEKDLPGNLFWWEGDDGTRVLTSRPPLHYPSHGGDILPRIDEAADQAHPEVGHVMCFYGVGNHGGGPTRANLASILQAQARPDGPEVRFSDPDTFFAAASEHAAGLPVLHDELQHHARGCYTAVSRIKWYNRHCEHALLVAERFAALAWHLCGLPYPGEALAQAWEAVLFNQFHDILAGTSIKAACQDTYRAYEQVLATAEEIQERTLDALAAQVDTSGDARTLLLFNPLPWPQRAPVEVDLPVTRERGEDRHGAFRPGEVRITDELGRPMLAQIGQIRHEGAFNYARTTFMAELPPLGYRRYTFDFPRQGLAWSIPQPRPATVLENEYLRLTFDPQTGWLTSLLYKPQGIELLRGPAGVPLAIDDPSDTWSHDVAAFDDVIGRFEAQGDVALIADGPVYQAQRVTTRWRNSTVTLVYRLTKGWDQVTLDVTIDWHEQLTMLKLAFPLNLEAPQSTASIPYGVIQRQDDGGEEPCQSWVDMSGRAGETMAGLTILNDSKYGYSAQDGELRLSLLRSPVYAYHQPRELFPDIVYEYTDQGTQEVRLALVPHIGDWRQADPVRRALALNEPVVARLEPNHAGPWPAASAFVTCEPANVVLTVVKRAEDGDDLILRSYETAGQAVTAEIGLHGTGTVPCAETRQRVPWRPYELKTLRWNPNTGQLREVNGLEEAEGTDGP